MTRVLFHLFVPRAIQFYRVFGFHPCRLREERYIKEALLRLGRFAQTAREWKSEWDNYDNCRSYYEEAFREYHDAFILFEHFASQLAAKMPHYSEVPEFVTEQLERYPVTREFETVAGPRPSTAVRAKAD